MHPIFFLSMIAFAITLIVTKSTILGSKREYVKKRYDASFVNGQKPGYIHWFWHAMWTCPMCLGFWVALPLAYFNDTGYQTWAATLIIFGINWLIHCAENVMFQSGHLMETLGSKEVINNVKNALKQE